MPEKLHVVRRRGSGQPAAGERGAGPPTPAAPPPQDEPAAGTVPAAVTPGQTPGRAPEYFADGAPQAGQVPSTSAPPLPERARARRVVSPAAPPDAAGSAWRDEHTVRSREAPAAAPGPVRQRNAAAGPAAPAGGPAPRRRITRHVDILAPEPETRRGTHVGDRAVRLQRPHVEGVRRLERGVYEIVSEPEPGSRFGRLARRLRRTMIGTPIRSEHESHERLSKFLGLAAFGTDNISSSAYATEELMRVLVLAGTAALALTMPISLAIVALLAVVVISYQQTIRAYPMGGGSYIVTSRNLGTIPGLVAGASILVDYILTVAVSVSAGVAALTSAFPALYENRVLLAVVAVALIAWGNLRGVKESGMLFAAPAYIYLASWFGLLGYGLFLYVTGAQPAYVPPPDNPAHLPIHGLEVLGLFLILRAFASGSVGLTGTEAIADGVAAFKDPTDRNARTTLILMAVFFSTIFLGISFLSSWLHLIPDPAELETVNSQLTRTLVGKGWYYYLVQFGTALLLVLAANTAFADFPRLASFMARDKFLPSHFMIRGGRLAFSNGIILLAIVAAVLILIFQGSVTALIPLYTIGVFLAFTLSQSGLVRRWWRLREAGWRWRLVVNSAGATVTAIVAVVVAVTKFALGAWVVLVLIPALVFLLLGIRAHFHKVAGQLRVEPGDRESHPDEAVRELHHYVLIPVADLNRAALRAIAYARSLTGQVNGNGAPGNGGRSAVIQAVHVTDDADSADDLQHRWERYDPGVELVIIESPYRAFIGPLLRFIDAVEKRHPEGTAIVTVLLPEYMPAHWWEVFLHTHTALQLKGALLFRPRTAVASVRYHLNA
ncbi:MAG: amino acid permease [Chloroflexi bacterium]|nr:amino acid permease [Chloroflexota bacterium]